MAPAWRWIFYLPAPLAVLSGLYLWAAAPAWPRQTTAGRLDVIGAALFTMTRNTQHRVPQEALIGIVYVVAAAAVRRTRSESP